MGIFSGIFGNLAGPPPISYMPPVTEGMSEVEAAREIHEAACRELGRARCGNDTAAVWRAIGRCEVAFEGLLRAVEDAASSDSDTHRQAET